MVTAIGEAAWAQLDAVALPLDEAALRELSPALILAPHPDDETLGCGGLLARLSALGLRPRVAYLTDGGASHRGSATWPPRRLAAARREEAIAALAELGVPVDDVKFIDWPDSAPAKRDSEAYRAAMEDVLSWIARLSARSVFSPWIGEGHCDHEAAALFASDLAERARVGLRQMAYLVWGWETFAINDGESFWRLECADLRLRRRRALACHRTQTSELIADAEESFLIPPALAALTDRPSEIYLELG